jgi:hypothetical protein
MMMSMAEIVPFPVVTLGELESPRGWSAALNLPLPPNPSFALLDAAIRELLAYQCALLCGADNRWLWIEEEELSNRILMRLKDLHSEVKRWQRKQRAKLGEGLEL